MGKNPLVGLLSLEEKASLLSFASLLDTKSIVDKDIPSIQMSDGPHGLRGLHNSDKQIEGGSVCYPTASAMAATWNTGLIYEAGRSIARDCIAQNIDILLAPGVNIKRNPLCGRNFEYFSEDPLLSGKLGAAYVKGVQSLGVGACVKHFAANNQETDRRSISAEVDERTLREIYLKPFEIVVKESSPACIMSAYNKINGLYCAENEWLLSKVLRNEWGYRGLVVSDWGGTHDISRSISAGLDLQMPHNDDLLQQLEDGLAKGLVTMDQIDDAVGRLIEFARDTAAKRNKQSISYDRKLQHSKALEVAREAITLLKNEDSCLPIDCSKYKKISVIGQLAQTPTIMGGGSSIVRCSPSYIDSPIDFIRKYAAEDCEINFKPVYSPDYFNPCDFVNSAAKGTVGAELVIIFAGYITGYESEGYDRNSVDLPEYINETIRGACRYCENVILVLQSGCVAVPRILPGQVKGLVQMWMCGEAGGQAIAEILFGIINPSGKLPETFMLKHDSDMDLTGNGKCTDYSEKLSVGYRYYDLHNDKVWFPFGHGLSYTSFRYSEPESYVRSSDKGDEELHISFKLTNTGKVKGKEVVQLYIRDVVSSVSKPYKELKHFCKVELEPGETEDVRFTVRQDDLEYYNYMKGIWHAEPGKYLILIGSSCTDIRLTYEWDHSGPAQYTLKLEGWPVEF